MYVFESIVLILGLFSIIYIDIKFVALTIQLYKTHNISKHK